MRARRWGLVVCTVAWSLAGCASQPAPVDNSLNRILADSPEAAPPSAAAPARAEPAFDLAARMDEVTLALEDALNAPAKAEQHGPAQDPTEAPAATVPDDGEEAGTAEEAAQAPEPAPPALDEIPTPALAAMLAERLRGEEARENPFGASVTLSFLESYFQLGAGGQTDASEDRLYRAMTPGQRQTLNAMRHLAHESLHGEARSGETGPAADVFDGLVFTLWDRDPVRIGRVALCEEVRRYGDYDALGSNRFRAGETARMVLYTELDRFRNVPEGTGWKVDLSLEVNVFSDSGRTLVWRMPETSYAMVSRRRIRDVFLPALVELPPTLGAGRYALKVIVHDRSDGSTDERILRVDLVADSGLR